MNWRTDARPHRPILPGVGAGGAEILDERRRHVGDAPPEERREWDRWGGEIVRYGPMSFTLREGLVVGIGLARGYTGTIDGRIGIGSTLEEASRVLGAVDTSNRVSRVAGRSGIRFDGTEPPPGQPPDPDGLCTLPLAMIERIVGGQHVAEAERRRDARPALHRTRPAIEASWYNLGHLCGRVR